jgi:hypothetical protein
MAYKVPTTYQLSFVAKVASALKRGKWPQKGVIWGLMFPKMVQFYPSAGTQNGQVSKFSKIIF